MAERLECPVCAGRGTRRGPPFRRGQTRDVCRLCLGAGSVLRTTLQSLCRQMQLVADAMQSGDEERAAKEARIAGHLALRLLRVGKRRHR
jgi:hypothetical protein